MDNKGWDDEGWDNEGWTNGDEQLEMDNRRWNNSRWTNERWKSKRRDNKILTFLQSSQTTQAEPRGPSCSPQRMQRFTPSPSTLRRMSSSRVIRRLERTRCHRGHCNPASGGPWGSLYFSAAGCSHGECNRGGTHPRGHAAML